MKALLPNILMTVGFCLGTVGAAGFHSPALSASSLEDATASTESFAWPLLLVGFALLFTGFTLSRMAVGKRKSAEDSHGGALDLLRVKLPVILEAVVSMDESKETLSDQGLLDQIDDILTGDFLLVASRNDELTKEMGFENFARVWEGVAVAERLLNRTWSMTADGHKQLGILELPKARMNLESSVRALESV